MSPTVANFGFEAINFLLLVGAVAWFALRPIRAALDQERARHSERQTELATRLAAVQAREDTLAQANLDAEQKLQVRHAALLETAHAEASAIVQEARKAGAIEREALHRERLAARDSDVRELGALVGAVAAAAVQRLLDTLDGPSLDRALLRGACQALPSSPAAPVVVESARPLDDEARGLLRRAVGHGFEERVVPDLGAGVKIVSVTGQLDATAAAIARTAAAEIGRTIGAGAEA